MFRIESVYVLGINLNYKIMFAFLVYKDNFIIIWLEIARIALLEHLQLPILDYATVIHHIKYSSLRQKLVFVPNQLQF